MDKLKTLDQHNGEAITKYLTQQNMNQSVPTKNGIACPMCGNELYDSCPDLTLTSNPPQKDIHCIYCDYRGYRIA